VDHLVPPTDSGIADSVIKLNHVVHHAGLGHHVQNWHASRAPSRIGRVAAVDGAYRIAMLAGGTMAEGWASYATVGWTRPEFLTPLESFAEHPPMLGLPRAIVDVELHRGRMSLDEAESFYRVHANMSAGRQRVRGDEEQACSRAPPSSTSWIDPHDPRSAASMKAVSSPRVPRSLSPAPFQ
jgi:hypothetical protein